MPPKRSFTHDDYAGGSSGPPGPSPFPPKRRKTFPSNEWRRPLEPHDWWTVPEPEWDRMAPAMKMNWTHVGRIMETDEGEPAAEPCEQCMQAGDARHCWVYTRDAMRRYGFKTHVCAKCRATAKVCSLNPYFRNIVGLRDNRPPPPQQPLPSQTSPFPPPPPGERSHWFPSPRHERYRSPTPPSERYGAHHSPDYRPRFPSPGDRDRYLHGDRDRPAPWERHRIPSPPERHRDSGLEMHPDRERLPPSEIPLAQTTPPHAQAQPQSQHLPVVPPHLRGSNLESIVESLTARMEALEEQMETIRKENLLMEDENGFLRWRIAELEEPASSARETELADADGNDADGNDKKPPPALTSEQSASAVETLVMEESFASSLREQQEHHDKEPENSDDQVSEKPRQHQVERHQELERQQELETQRAADLAALREENGVLTRRVLELEKGQEMTTQILRDLYYALDD